MPPMFRRVVSTPPQSDNWRRLGLQISAFSGRASGASTASKARLGLDVSQPEPVIEGHWSPLAVIAFVGLTCGSFWLGVAMLVFQLR